MLDMLKEFSKKSVYVSISLKSSDRKLEGYITRITWDDMDDIIHIIHPLTKNQSFCTLKMIDDVSILKP